MFQRMINKYHYAIESIKNRYPCKIVSVKNIDNFNKPAEIQYVAATKINVRISTAKDILEDPLLVEKFHPTDGVKLGFLACGEILLREGLSKADARILYLQILESMFHGY